MKDDDKLSVDEAIALIEQHMDPANLESGNVTTNLFGGRDVKFIWRKDKITLMYTKCIVPNYPYTPQSFYVYRPDQHVYLRGEDFDKIPMDVLYKLHYMVRKLEGLFEQ